MIKAIIFDWDGLLANTEDLWTRADMDWLSSRGIKYNDELKSELTGRGQKESAEIFRQTFSLASSNEEIIRQRFASIKKIYSAITENILMPGALETIRQAKARDLKIAIASGSAQDILDAIVKHQGVNRYFDCIISSDKVAHGKPAPDVYLYVASLLGIRTRECAVLEDAENGVKAAKAAGMKCIAVPNKHTAKQDFSMADEVISSLKEFNMEKLKHKQ